MRTLAGLLFLGLLIKGSSALAAPPTEWIALGQGWMLCHQSGGGTTNTSSSGSSADFAHNLSCTLDANLLRMNSVVEACAMYSLTTNSSGMPNLLFKLKAGAVTLAAPGLSSPTAPSLSGMSLRLCWQTIVSANPGAAVNTSTGPLSYLGAAGAAQNHNATLQPVALATNGALVWTAVTQWVSAGTGVNSVTLNAFEVKVAR
jgi:hypothetical protein